MSHLDTFHQPMKPTKLIMALWLAACAFVLLAVLTSGCTIRKIAHDPTTNATSYKSWRFGAKEEIAAIEFSHSNGVESVSIRGAKSDLAEGLEAGIKAGVDAAVSAASKAVVP